MNETAEPTPDVSDESVLPESSASDTPASETPARETPTVVVPDRADAPVSEVTERFLRAVIAKVPLERIEELHLFAPLRQGGVETGIAVVAARVPLPDPVAEVDTSEASDAAPGELPLDAVDVSMDAEVDREASGFDEAPDVADADVEVEVVEAVSNAADETEIVMETTMEVVAEGDTEGVDDDDSPYRSPYLDDVVVLPSDAPDDEVMSASAIPETPVVPPIVRHTVYTARYRLVLKGPERGRWETDVVDEADAPLITVETVVRGVQRRAGEESETLRYTDRQIARALRLPWPLPGVDAATTPEVHTDVASDAEHV